MIGNFNSPRVTDFIAVGHTQGPRGGGYSACIFHHFYRFFRDFVHSSFVAPLDCVSQTPIELLRSYKPLYQKRRTFDV